MSDNERWEERYTAEKPPWDTGQPDRHLLDLITTQPVSACRTLEIGCGTGTNAVWLAGQGFDVTAIDLSPTAIDAAKARAGELGLDCSFSVGDIMTASIDGAPFELVFDRGCFHCFFKDVERARFAEQVEAHLAPGGLWFSLAGSTDGPARDHGPPRCSARDVATAVEERFEILSLVSTHFEAKIPSPARAWRGLYRRRVEPAQPSTTSMKR